MNSTHTKILIATFTLLVAGSMTLTGCQTARMKPGSQVSGVRNPAAEDALIRSFIDELAQQSALGSESAVEDAMTQLVNDNADRLSIQKISSLDDLTSLSEADQKRILDELVQLPDFSRKLEVNLDAVQTARSEALENMQDNQGISTQAVQDIRQMSDSGKITFGNILKRDPELRNDVALMIHENDYIAKKTGTPVLAKGCDEIQSEPAVEDVVAVMAGVNRDVAAGVATDVASDAKSLERNMEYTLGTSPSETHERICALADQKKCGIFVPSMCR